MNTVDELAISSIRFLTVDAVQKANSGHPGMPMGTAPMAYTLWKDFMKFNPEDAKWNNRDRFVLSAGHGSMLIYSLLHLFGYDLTMEDIKQFRQWGSKTPGHPEYGHTIGVETTTGPLGSGISEAVGMALAERYLANYFNKENFDIVDHYTYVIAGDGCLMEGISSEACSFAGHQKLNKLIVFYDDNNITIDGSTDIAFTEDVTMRYKAYGWNVISVKDGNDVEEIKRAIRKAKKSKDKPTLIRVKTIIGYGCVSKAGTHGIHGSPAGPDEIKLSKEAVKWDYEPFTVPSEVYEEMKKVKRSKKRTYSSWKKLMKEYETAYPDMYAEYMSWHNDKLLKNVDVEDLYNFDKDKYATRNASNLVMNKIAKAVPNFLGGSADLTGSNNTELKGMGSMQAETPLGRNIHYGVREHGMAAIMNGMTLHGGLKTFGATYLVFSDYLRPQVRLAALMNINPTFILTHDSLGVGEDGPTHQPIETLASLQMIPNLYVYRPADARETAAGWIKTMEDTNHPYAMVYSRQDLPVLEGTSKDAERGGYILIKEEKKTPDAILMGSGSEVQHLVKAHKELLSMGIDTRVVSMPCMKLFEEQEESYKESVLPKEVKARLAMEAGVGYLWCKILGKKGVFLGIDHFGASAPGNVLMEKFGFTSENIVNHVKEMVK